MTLRRTLRLTLAVLCLAGVARAQDAPAPEAPSGRDQPAVVEAERFMIATANAHATDAGAAILRRGGSAADAMVAAQLVLNLVEPQSSGIGGGAFLLHWDAEAASPHDPGRPRDGTDGGRARPVLET